MSNRVIHILYHVAGLLVFLSYAFGDVVGWEIACPTILICSVGTLTILLVLAKGSRQRLFQRLADGELPRRFRRHVERFTPDMEREGLTSVGDFLIYPEPLALRSRAFSSDDGRCFGYVAAKSDLYFFGFCSVFADGTYLESSPLKATSKLPAPDAPIRFAFLPDASIAELFAFHQREIESMEASRNTHVLQFAPDQCTEVSDYGHRLADWDLYNRGHRWTPPKPSRPRPTAPVAFPEGGAASRQFAGSLDER